MRFFLGVSLALLACYSFGFVELSQRQGSLLPSICYFEASDDKSLFNDDDLGDDLVLEQCVALPQYENFSSDLKSSPDLALGDVNTYPIRAPPIPLS